MIKQLLIVLLIIVLKLSSSIIVSPMGSIGQNPVQGQSYKKLVHYSYVTYQNKPWS